MEAARRAASTVQGVMSPSSMVCLLVLVFGFPRVGRRDRALRCFFSLLLVLAHSLSRVVQSLSWLFVAVACVYVCICVRGVLVVMNPCL